MKRKACAVWKGGLKTGHGTISTESGVLSDTEYAFVHRFEDEVGTNPEELVAAAHASCFSMALSAQMESAGITPARIDTVASVTLEKRADGFAIPEVHLDVIVVSPGADEEVFREAAERAKTGCPISKLLNARITMAAKLNAA